MSDWKYTKIGDVCKRVCSGGTPSSRHLEYYDGDVPWLNTKEINFNRIYSTERCITKEGLKNSSAKWIDKNAVIVAMYGATAGKTAINKIPLTTNQACCNLMIDSSKADYRFVYYALNNRFTELASLANGGAQQNLNAQIIKDFEIALPPIPVQKNIANILSSIDDKIEYNKRINENLEQQAQALFKSWFVDFEPFKDQPFVESELGMIPQGWRVGRYEDIIDSTISGDWGKEKAEGNYTHKVACIRGCDFQDIKNGLRGKTPERYILEKNYQTKHFKDKDVLVEISGGTATVSTGRVCPVSQLLIDKYDGDIVCTNFCRLVRPKDHYGAYLYYSWLFKYSNKVMFGYENGTSGIKNFRIKDFVSLEPIIIPSEDSLKRFQSFINQLQIKLQMNGSEIQKLAELRDALLPKLMSGEINVSEVNI